MRKAITLYLNRYGRTALLAVIVVIAWTLLGGFAIDQIALGQPASEYPTKLRIAGDNRFPPFEFESNGTYQGFDVDMMNALSIETGITFELYPMPWSEALKALESGRVDAIQGMKYSGERADKYSFSEPYFTSTQSIFVLKDNYSVFSLADLQHRSISMQEGDITGEVLRKVPNARMIAAENQEEAIRLLIDRKVDAFVGNQITGQYVLQTTGQHELVKLVGDPISPTDYGMVVLKGNERLLEPLNEAIRTLKKNGTYRKIERKWLGEYIYPAASRLRGVLTAVLAGLVIITAALLLIVWWNIALKRELRRRINDYKRTMDELARKDRLQSLGQMVAGIAHEIRNPITSILSYSQLLPIKYDNPQYREFFAKHVTDEVMRLNRIVTDLLDFARDKPPEKSVFPLSGLVESVVLYFQPIMEKKGIEMQAEVPEAYRIEADIQQMKQVLINLLKNAIEAMDAGGKVTIEAIAKQRHIRLSIRDTGSGIDPDDHSQIFNPFFTRKAGGAGLGLSICYRLVTENGGSIHLFSEKGAGTTAVVSLPRPKGESDDA
jgi:signal transduction histidine kinase